MGDSRFNFRKRLVRRGAAFTTEGRKFNPKEPFWSFLDSLDVNLLLVESCLNHCSHSLEATGGIILSATHWSDAYTYVFFPTGEWIADTWFGRYKVINTGLCIFLDDRLTFSLVPFKKYLHLLVFFHCCFVAIQFATDHMIEIGALFIFRIFHYWLHWPLFLSYVGLV